MGGVGLGPERWTHLNNPHVLSVVINKGIMSLLVCYVCENLKV
jgi:hypothetical protein